MPSSINGWTMPNWEIYDLAGLYRERAICESAIKNHLNNPAADNELSYWHARLESINAAIAFQELAGKH